MKKFLMGAALTRLSLLNLIMAKATTTATRRLQSTRKAKVEIVSLNSVGTH